MLLCFRDLQIIASYVNTIFAMYTSYLLSFQSIFNDFAFRVCLLLLIVVALYFICLYFVYLV